MMEEFPSAARKLTRTKVQTLSHPDSAIPSIEHAMIGKDAFVTKLVKSATEATPPPVRALSSENWAS